MNPTTVSELIKQLEQVKVRYPNIDVWVQLHHPDLKEINSFGERLTSIRIEPIPPGDPVCVIHAEPA